jgi:8-oxo-dGTP pyrophosphatase MutT (NUDIX family)
MSAARVVVIDKLELTFAPRPWRFAEQRRAEIDAEFARMKREKPELWNGRVLLLHSHAVEPRMFRGQFLETDYASFTVWRGWGMPEADARDCFAQGVLRAADGAILLGVMAPHTANAGEIYFPGGTPEPGDLAGTAVDFEASVRREVAEETGLEPADYDAEPGWRTVFDGPTIAHLKVLHLREDAAALRARILEFLARERQPELSDIRIVHGPADLDPRMPGFVRTYLASAWAARD